MESSCPSMMVVCAGGSKGNGRIQFREFPLKIHTSGKMLLQGPIPFYKWTNGQMDRYWTLVVIIIYYGIVMS